MLAYYVAAAVSGLIFARLVAGMGWQGAGLVQLTLLPLVGLAVLVLVDVRRVHRRPSLRRSGPRRRHLPFRDPIVMMRRHAVAHL
jgi:hypothetical protein